MWVLILIALGSPIGVTLHNFDDFKSCEHAKELIQGDGRQSQIVAYCTQDGWSVFGAHDDLTLK